ncbi:hypothetical protein F5887DRAFT_1284308 [Amanita rubescens]|nr:hypothetical protein F5887DRAFT_1284308 [Amanita rubescens]
MSSDECYETRTTSGLYDTFIQNLLNLGNHALANIEWRKDWKRDPNDSRELIFSDGRPFTTVIFGEIASASMGTRHSAMGNHYVGSNKNAPNSITDKSTIKDIFILRHPTNAPDDLSVLYDYQLDNLNKLRVHDSDMEYDGGVCILGVTEIPRAPSNGADADLIATHLGPKYVVPKALASSTHSNANNSRTAPKRVFRSRDDHPSVTRKSSNEQATPLPSEISVGSFYDPHLLPDYGGPVFRLVNARLVQRDIVDCNDDLIAPWQMHDKLRPGTLVLMKVQLLTFEVPDRQKDGFRKIYQFLIDRIRVVAISTEEMESPNKSSKSGTSRVTSVIGQRDETDDALDDLFATKKRKVTNENQIAASTSTPPFENTMSKTDTKAEIVEPPSPTSSKTRGRKGKPKAGLKTEPDVKPKGGKGKVKKIEVESDNTDGETEDVEMGIDYI